jgi:KaiC/GvpD/RAD55 family RecA-like ATPase
MKVGGGLNYVTGPMGSGKSLFGVRKIVQATLAGQYAITNVRLYDDWAERVARHYFWYCLPATRKNVAAKLRAHYVFEEDLQKAMRYRVPGKGEARAVFVWDEGHNDLNNRDWRKDGRDDILKWATQLRKLGFVGYLLSQHADNTDAALRRVANFHIRLQNQREQQRVLGLRLTPWPLFLAFWVPAHLGQQGARVAPVKLERYFLSWHRKLYDTWGLFHGLADGDLAGADIELLPEGGRATDSVSAPTPPRKDTSDRRVSIEAPRNGKGLPAGDPSPNQRRRNSYGPSTSQA